MLARGDAFVPVRTAALAALGRQGDGAAALITERLADPDWRVRGAALRALAEVGSDEAWETLLGFATLPPGRENLEAARLLARRPESGLYGPGRDALLLGLRSEDEALRGQAIVAFSAVRDLSPLVPALLAALRVEAAPTHRVGLSEALLRSEVARDEAAATLAALLPREDRVGVLAARALARLGSDEAAHRLQRALEADDLPSRRIAAAALATEAGRPGDAFPALRDPDPFVRIFAAGAIARAR